MCERNERELENIGSERGRERESERDHKIVNEQYREEESTRHTGKLDRHNTLIIAGDLPVVLSC